MSDEESEMDYEPMMVQGAIDSYGDRGQVLEPILAQLDDWSKYTVSNLLYEWKTIENPNTGKSVRVPVKCYYPDIENAMGFALSHHNLIMNFTWEESRALLLRWRGKLYRPLMYKYKRTANARTILTALDAIFERNVIGGSSGGSHQAFLWRMQGGFRGIQINKGEEKK